LSPSPLSSNVDCGSAPAMTTKTTMTKITGSIVIASLRSRRGNLDMNMSFPLAFRIEVAVIADLIRNLFLCHPELVSGVAVRRIRSTSLRRVRDVSAPELVVHIFKTRC